MKQKLRFSLLMLLMAVFSGVWAQTVLTSSIDMTTGTNAASLDGVVVTADFGTLTYHKGTGSNPPAYYSNGTAVRFYAYLHNLELYRVMSEVGFRLSDVANLYHSMRVFFQDFGIRLEDPPRLFNDKLDSRYVQENMDHRISHLYPKYPKLCDDSVIVDIQSIGFTVEGEQPVSTFIALYFKPVE